MSFEIKVSEHAAKKIASKYGTERGATGEPSEWDFWGTSILTAARLGFRNFNDLDYDDDPKVRRLHLFDPIFGPVILVGVFVESGVIEIADFESDPDYWDMVKQDPDCR